MRIGIDLRPLSHLHRFRGIGVYLSNLSRAIADLDIGHELRYIVHDGAGADRIVAPNRLRHELLLKCRNRVRQSLRLSREQLDVVLLSDIGLGVPAGDVPVVAVAYDVIPLLFRQHYYPRPLTRTLRERGARWSVGNVLELWLLQGQRRAWPRARHVIAISEATRRDLLAHFPRLRPEAVSVVRPAQDPAFRPIDDPSVLARHGLRRPFLLYVGGVDFRKDVTALIEAFDAVRHDGLQLALVGQGFAPDRWADNPELHRRLAATEGIVNMAFVSTAELAAVYSAAELFVFPSRYEGFGLPPLEAMACGCPVLALRNSSIPEVVGDAALLLERSDELAGAIAQLLSDEPRRQDLAARGRERAATFSWERTAAETVTILEAAAR